MEIVSWLLLNWVQVLGYLTAILTGLIGIFMLVPGDEPETTLRKIVDILAKFSLKK
jgi:hypothetical protein